MINKQMRRRTKIIITTAGIILFLTSAPAAIFYSKGYRFDFSQRKIVKTGALFFHTNPHPAQIIIDGKKKKRSSLVFGSAMINDLMPGTHHVEIQKPEYKTWSKKLEVKEGGITTAKNITLVPEKIGLEVLEENVKDFWVSGDNRLILLQKEEEGTWFLDSLNLENQKKTTLLKKENPLNIEKVVWSPDKKKVALKTKKELFILPTEEVPATIKPLPLSPDTEPLFFSPVESDILYFKAPSLARGSSLSRFDISKETEEEILKNFKAVKLHWKEIYWINEEGQLEKSDLKGNSQVLPFLLPPLEEKEPIELLILKPEILILNNNVFYELKRERMTFREITRGINQFVFSPDGTKLALLSNHEVKILSLKEQKIQPLRAKGEITFLTRFSGEIKQVFWWNPNYLVLLEEQAPKENEVGEAKIKVIETDNRDKAQIWEVARGTSPKIYFSSSSEKLFLLTRENLFVSKAF